MLTHLFTPDQCAQCKLCCNFKRSSAWETPALDTHLSQSLQAKGVPLMKRKDGSCTFLLQYESSDPTETSNCPMLDPHSGCMLPREERPFECRIWPIRIMKEPSGRLVLGLYMNCPALTESVRKKLIQEATKTLLPTLLQHAQDNPHIVRPPDPAYTIIWRK